MIERSHLSLPDRNEGLIDTFTEFFSEYKADEIKNLPNLATKEPIVEVEFEQLQEHNSSLIEMLYEQPDRIIHNAELAIMEMIEQETIDDETQVDEVTVRLIEPFDDKLLAIRDIRDENVGELISIEGIVSQHIEVKPKIEVGVFRCSKCGARNEKYQPAENLAKPRACVDEDCSNTTASNFYPEYERSETLNFQKVRVQEPPSELEGGEDPQKIDVLLRGDDVTGLVRGGEKVTVSGVLRTTESQERAVLDTYVDANNLEKEEKGTEDMDISEEEEERIKTLANRDDIYDILTESISPSIKGHLTAKRGAAFQAFGGVRKKFEDSSTTIRGDIHVLYVGDPGVGKSQILQYIKNVSTSGVYTSGKGSSSAGLCVGGDTIVQYDGDLIPIKELVEKHIPESVDSPTAVEEPFETVAFDGDTTTSKTATHLWRMPEQDAVTLTTQKGREVTVSPQTPLLVSTENGAEWVEADEISEGSHIASPAHIEYETDIPDPRDYFEFGNETLDIADEDRTRIRTALKEEYGTLRDAASELGFGEDFMYTTLLNRKVPYDRLQKVLAVTGIEFSSVTIEAIELRQGNEVLIPQEFSEDFGWLLGLVFGDGSLSVSDDRETVRIANSDEEILANAARVFESEFGVRPQIEYPAEDVRPPEIRVSSKTLVQFFQNLGMDTSPKTDLRLDGEIAVSSLRTPFLQGYFDANGGVNTRKTNGGTSVSVSSISESLIEQVQLLLLYEGVDSRIRERERAGDVNQLSDGREIVSKHNQYELSISGSDIPKFAEEVGFSQRDKVATLNELCSEIDYRGSIEGVTPVESDGDTVLDLGQTQAVSSEAEQSLRWSVVTDVSVTTEELYDLTTIQSNFIANGLVVHNTASAVRDAEFGGTDQWTLKAGAMVIADKGIACIDELDKMEDSDRSAMHEALEQQQVSISKAGINATLKSRCSLLAAANPIHGRFDEYEPITEQIDMEPALVSRFDLIFIIQDQPDEEDDSEIASHILQRNRQGQKNARKVSEGEALDVVEEDDSIAEISQDLLKKYIAYAQRNVFPEMTDSAENKLEEFYVNLRTKDGGDSDAIPITARKLEALVRLAEASARIRLSESVTVADADRAIDIMMQHLEEVGMDPDTGELDADRLEAGTTHSQRERIKTVEELIEDIREDKQADADKGEIVVATEEEIIARADAVGIDESEVENTLEKLAREGDIYSPGSTDGYQLV